MYIVLKFQFDSIGFQREKANAIFVVDNSIASALPHSKPSYFDVMEFPNREKVESMRARCPSPQVL